MIVSGFSPSRVLLHTDRRVSCAAATGDAKHTIAQHIAEGMLYLHDKQLAHLDLKSLNVLIKGKVAKLVDFGSTRKFYDMVCPAEYDRKRQVDGVLSRPSSRSSDTSPPVSEEGRCGDGGSPSCTTGSGRTSVRSVG